MRLPRPLIAACLLALVAAVFLPCVGFEFVSWDDPVYVTDNPQVRSLSPGNLATIATSFVSGNYHPLPILSHAVEYRLFGLDPRAFHAVNLALHLANTLLVYALLTALGGGAWTSAAAALLFAVHPQRVESVAWVADRKDLLCALFFLASLLGYLSYVRTRRRGPYLASLAAAALSMLSKATAAVLPLVLLLLDQLLGRKPLRASLREKAPFVALSLACGVLAILARGSYQAELQEGRVGLPVRAALGVHRLVHYFLARLAWPAGHEALNPFYTDPGAFLPPLSDLAVAVAVLAALGGLVFLVARRTPAVLFGALFFLATIAPVFPTVVLGQSADRFTYLPAAGAAFAVEAALRRFAGPGRARARAVLAAIAVAALAGAGAFLSRREAASWRSSEAVWSAAVRTFPTVGSFHNQLGLARLGRGDAAGALAEFERAVALAPRHADAYNNRGIVRAGAGDARGAVADFERALALEPANARAHNNLGNAYAAGGDDARAGAEFDAALAADPRLPEALLSRGNLRARGGDLPGALADLSAAIAARPGYAEALKSRGVVFDLGGDTDRALADLSAAIALNPNAPEYYRSRVIVLVERGEYGAARRDAERLRQLGRPLDPALAARLARGGG